MKSSKLFVFILLILGGFAKAQRPPVIVSPQVHADKSVTFRYFSKTAKEVKLSGEFLKDPVSLSKDTSGVWSITVPSITPDIYPYNFVVDGTGVSDPNNTYVFANERFKRSIDFK